MALLDRGVHQARACQRQQQPVHDVARGAALARIVPQRMRAAAAAAAASQQAAQCTCSEHQRSGSLTRRQLLAGPAAAAAAAVLASAAVPRRAAAAEAPAGLVVVEDVPGTGSAEARAGDLVLIHYTGKVEATGEVFDSTLGLGLTYRDGGPGVLRPAALRLGGPPLPGICAALTGAVTGMRVGGTRTVVAPPELAFGAAPAAAPYAIVPPGAAVRYEVQLLRLSRVGPDALVRGISRCGQGGQSAAADNCGAIEPAEFL